MNDRPWLEALKEAIKERGAAADETSEKTSKVLPSEGCERCKSPTAEVPSPVVNVRIAEKVCDSGGDEERRLITAGWKPKERGGLVIWANPESGFYCSQEVALHRLKRQAALGIASK